GDAALVAKWMINELPRALAGKEVADVTASGGTLDAERFAELVALLRDGTLTTAAGKTVLAQMVATGQRAGALAAQAAPPAVDVGPLVDAVIAAHADTAAQYKAGKTGLLGFCVGQVMRSTPNADAATVNQVVRERLG